MRLPVTTDEMRDAVQEVHTALPRYQLTVETMPQTVRIYREALLPYDGEAVRGAAKMGLRTWEKFPSPAAWRETVREWIKHNRPMLEYRGAQDEFGRDIACRTCRSVARSAWLRRADGTEYSRLVAPCHLEKHAAGDLTVPSPENFVSWDDRPNEERFSAGALAP